MFSLIFPVRESCKFQHISIRKIHKINILDFRADILKSDLIRCPYKTASLLSHQYFNILRSLLDKHESSHSTETALLKIQNDIAFSVDSGKAVALTLLDLSAAFDTIDHSLLYDCLHGWFGLDGTVLLWIKSYLSNRKQKIKIGDSFSESVIFPFGVPQGSILGPLLFTLYTSPLSQVISKLNVTHHLYADDTQIYLAVYSRNFDSSMAELTECLKLRPFYCNNINHFNCQNMHRWLVLS